MLINIQSFGDIITNSSSEVYCLYDWSGMEQIEDAIKNIVKVINPDIKIEDHLEFSLVPEQYTEFYDEDLDEDVSYEEFYNKEFQKYCEENSDNSKLLRDFPKWYRNFIEENSFDGNGRPKFILQILPKSELGETLAVQINRILYAFEYEEIYDG